MIILEVIAVILGFVAMLSASALGVHVLLEDSEILGRLKNKLKAPDEVEMLKRATLEREAEAEKREELEHWAQRMERVEKKLRRLESNEPEPTHNIYPDTIEWKYPDDKVGTEMRLMSEKRRAEKRRQEEASNTMKAFQKFGNTVDEWGEEYHRATTREWGTMEERLAEKRRIAKNRKAQHIYGLARRTMRGDFGDGDRRRYLLGDDYEAVQAEVNRMCKRRDQIDAVMENSISAHMRSTEPKT